MGVLGAVALPGAPIMWARTRASALVSGLSGLAGSESEGGGGKGIGTVGAKAARA